MGGAVELDSYSVFVTRIAKNSPINVPFLPLKIEIDNAWLDDIDLYFFAKVGSIYKYCVVIAYKVPMNTHPQLERMVFSL